MHTLRYITLSTLLFMGLFAITACDSTDAMDEGALLEGQLVNATDRPVRNATVSLADRETTTNDEGIFTFTDVDAGSYTITYDAPGYTSVSESINVSSSGTTLDAVTLLGSATISGTVVDAQTGQGASEATVIFIQQSGSSSALRSQALLGDNEIADLLIETDENGTYTIADAPTGSFQLIIRRDGYQEAVFNNVVVGEGSNEIAPRPISESLQEGEVRIVLSWGEQPRDLDAHLTGPLANTDSRFHVYWANRSPSGSNAELDRDDVSSFGPETITITALRDGMYRYSVHNFSNQSENGGVGIYESPTEVSLYDENGRVASYTAPPADEGDGNTWRVFELNVSNGSVSLDDANGDTLGYVQASRSSDMDTFAQPVGAKSPVVSPLF